jgi:branched-chain amino acid transport system ATP-binding protein
VDEALRVDHLTAGYGNLKVINDINIVVSRGSLTAVIGPNGSGKSTLLKSIVGLASIHQGDIKVHGKTLTGLKPFEIANMNVAYLPQTNNVFTKLTVDENLKMAGHLLSKTEARERASKAYEFFPMLKSMKGRQAGWLSGGERQILSLAMAFVRQAELLLLDEPTAALAPKVASQVVDKIIEMNTKLGTTIILVEQNALKALEISENAYLLVAGRVSYEGPSESLLKNSELGKMYLGLRPH